MNKRNQNLIKNIISFAFGKIGIRLISFLLVPVYTHMLSTDEYGTLDLITTVCTVLVPILTLNIYESVMRFCLDKGADREQILSIATSVLAVGSVAGLLIIPISYYIPSFANLSWYIYAYMITSAIMQVFLAYLRGCERLYLYSIGNIIHTALAAVLNIAFLVGLRMGVEGYLLAYILSNFATAIFAVIAGQAYRAIKRIRFDRALINSMLRFSVVLIPNSFMWWIINSSDRAMVTAMVGAAANGIYAVAYKVPSLLTAAAETFNWAWSHSAVREQNSKDEIEYHNTVYNYMVQMLTIAIALILLVIKPFVSWYTAPEYYSSWMYVPYLLLGFMFMSLGAFIGTSYYVQKNNFGFLISGVIGAFVNIVLNMLLIPVIGVTGAALATCISYFSVYIFRAIDTGKYIKINILRWKHLLCWILLIGMSVLLFWENMIGKILMFILALIIIYLSRDIVVIIIQKAVRRKRSLN